MKNLLKELRLKVTALTDAVLALVNRCHGVIRRIVPKSYEKFNLFTSF
jgi:hypothetical protein